MVDKDKIQVGDKLKTSDPCFIKDSVDGVFIVVEDETLGSVWIENGKVEQGYELENWYSGDFTLVATNTKHTDVQEGDLVEVALVSEDKLKLWPTMGQLIGKTATVQRKGHQLELYFLDPISVPGFNEQQHEFIFDAHEIRVVKKNGEYNPLMFEVNGQGYIDSKIVQEPNCQVPIEPIANTLRIGDELVAGPIKSDGGSSSYYDLPLIGDLLKEIDSRRAGDVSYIKTEELIQTVFKNNFSFGTLFKSLIRAQSVVDGVGKAGNDLEYECNKIIYYANQIKELYGNK